MSNKNYSWIKPGVHAWVEGLVLPVEVEVVRIVKNNELAFCVSGLLSSAIHYCQIYQTESECLEAMKKKL